MTKSCRSCGRDISDRPKRHFLCLHCYADAARRLKVGETPMTASSGPTCRSIGLTAERATQLIKLAHPDLHDGSEAATDATQWLLAVRERLTQGERQNG